MHQPPSPRDPFLPLDFRWRSARACVEQGRPPAACDDRWVREAARFLAGHGDRPGPGDLARLAEQMPAVAQAHDLRQADPPHLRWAVEARLLAGGGLKTGQVIGRSDATASRPATTGYTPANLFATVMRFLFDVGKLRLRSDVNRDIKAALENTPAIEELF